MNKIKLILSSFFLVLGTAIVANHFFVTRISSQTSSREIANISERNSSDQLAWERHTAIELSKQDLIGLAENPSWLDHLALDYLAGKYNIEISDGRLKTITLKSNLLGQRVDTREFLDKFVKKFTQFESFKITHIDSLNEVADLFSKNGSRTGTVTFTRDASGRVSVIKSE